MRESVVDRVRRIQIITIGWMVIEAAGSLVAAWMAGSAALLAFGGDSAIELISASVVLWRFRSLGAREREEKLAARISGVLLVILALYVVAVSVMKLLGHAEPAPSFLGIAILAFAAVFMPLLARAKRALSGATGSAALRADAAESSLCGYLSLIALAGLVINAVWRAPWADPAAALAITPLVLWEAREALRGKPCDCC
ncbi:MAG: cation diffusion facilitator family transporter [Candidatus Acidiferrales bacterium]